MTDGGAPESGAQERPESDQRGWRERSPALLVALATVLAVTSVLSTWVKVQVLETDAWVSLSDQLLDEPQVQEALSAYLVDEIFAQLDSVQSDIADALPDDLKGLAGPLTAALRGPAATAVQDLVGSERFRSTWLTANRVAHETLVAILRDETGPALSTSGGALTLDLGELLRQVAIELGLSGSVIDRLPPDAGVITLLQPGELDTARSAVSALDFLAWFLTGVVAALYAAAVYFAGDRRLVVLRNVGLSLIGGGVFVLAVRAIAVRFALDAIVTNPGNQPLANVTLYVATGLVRQMAWSGIVDGVLIAGFASVLGSKPWARASRRVLSPLLNASTGAVAGGTAAYLVLVLAWSPGRAFDGWVSGLLLLGLLVGAVVALRSSTQREFPDVTFDDLKSSFWDASAAI